MDFLNGYKTYLGIAGMFVIGGIQVAFPDLAAGSWDEMAMQFFQGLTLVGAAHKADKIIEG